jgi:DNA-binding response OmpR family regulator
MGGYLIVVIEDEEEMGTLITSCLEEDHQLYILLKDGKNVLSTLKNNPVDLVLIDLILPDCDGFELVREIRSRYPYLPVIIVSAKQDISDKVLGLGLGADDYVIKPFKEKELLARIKSNIRRAHDYSTLGVEKSFIIQGNLKLDLKTYKLYKNGKAIKLSATQFRLMKFFMENPEQVFSINRIHERVWSDSCIADNSIMVSIHHLRDIIEDDPQSPKYIQNEWGFGYKFVSRE